MAEVDLSQVKWDDAPQVDLSKVQWDDAPKKPLFGPEGFAQAMREELDLQNPNPITRVALGVAGSVDDAAMRLKQLVGRSTDPISRIARALGVSGELTPEEQQAVIANRINREDIFGLTGGIAGNLAMTGAPAGAMYRGIAGAVPATAGVVARTLAPTAAAAATGGVLADATTPVLPGESENRNVALGAAGGAIGDAAGRIVGRVLSPVKPTPEAQLLMREGVQPTMGQAAGANSFLGRVEQRLMSVPIVGDLIKRSRDRAVGEFNEAAIRRALPANKKGEIVGAGRASLEKAHRILSDAYDDVLSRVGTVNVDAPFGADVARIVRDPDIALTSANRDKFLELLNDQFKARATNQQLTADVWKKIDTKLGEFIRDYGKGGTDERALGRAFAETQRSFREMFARSAGPEDAKILKEINGHYANLLRVENAAGRQAATDGVFSPAQLSAAVRQKDTSRNHRAYAQGKAKMQDLSDAGRSVLGDTVPNSGTTDRALWAYGLGGLGAGANEQYDIGPGWLTAALLSPLLYSRAGAGLMTGAQTPTLSSLIQSSNPSMTALGAYLGREEFR